MTKKIIKLLPVILLCVINLYAQKNQSNTVAKAPKIFMFPDITVHDTVIYEQYRVQVEPIIKQFEGKYLIRSGGMAFYTNPTRKVIPVEGGWNPDRLIIVQWNSMEQLQKFATSAEYIAITGLRANSATTKSIIVKEYLN
jgi:uncharacterized protein (DUF1330 family)